MTGFLIDALIVTGLSVFVVSVIYLIRFVHWRVTLKVVERTVLEDGVELRLSDGSVWRSDHGFVWHSFPDGNRAYLELEFFLDHENDRLKLINEWSEDS